MTYYLILTAIASILKAYISFFILSLLFHTFGFMLSHMCFELARKKAEKRRGMASNVRIFEESDLESLNLEGIHSGC